MSRRKAKKLDWVISAVASGVMAFSPMSLMAQEFGFSDPSLSCPLAENQCSEYLYEVYSRAPEFSGPTPGSTHDFPEATLAPIIPAISDDLAGHGAVTFGCGDYDRVRVAQRVELNLPRKLEDVDADLALQQLAALDLTTIDEVQTPAGIDFQGTCYEQSINARHRTPSVYRLMRAPTMLGDLVQHAVSDAIHHANRLREEYTPYDLVTGPDASSTETVDYWQAHQHLDIQAAQAPAVDYWQAHQHLDIQAAQAPAVDYWQAHQHLDIQAAQAPAVDYWQAHQHLDIQAAQAPAVDYWQAHQHLDIQAAKAAEFDLAIWAAAPALLQTYGTMILEHPYVQSPATLKRDVVQRIEMKLCGTPAMETWLQFAYGTVPADAAKVASPSVPVSTETVLWFANLLDQTGKQFQKASSRLSQMARTAENQREIR